MFRRRLIEHVQASGADERTIFMVKLATLLPGASRMIREELGSDVNEIDIDKLIELIEKIFELIFKYFG